MEALLPSEVARLVLGYLEEEKCGEAAKCFLEGSPHLNEYRMIAQRGKKYPTKVNGFSLKEILEEYCLVHSIVQESLSSMTDQQNTGGNMIESLRLLVRACQPVQVHINLHPQQGQGISLNKSDSLDCSNGSTRPRSKKSIHHGQTMENSDPVPNFQTQFSQGPIHGTSALSLTTLHSVNTQLVSQHHLQHMQHVTGPQVHHDVNVNMQYSSTNQTESGSHQETGRTSHSGHHIHMECNNIQSQEPYQSANEENYHELHHPAPTSQLPTSNSNEVSMPTGAEFMLEPVQSQANFIKPQQPTNSFVTKCYGSSIVILDNDDNISQPCMPSSGMQNSTNQGNNDAKLQIKMPTPIKTQVDLEQLREKFVNNEVLVTKLAENINKAWMPAKQSDESQALGEGSQGLDTFVEAAGSSFLREPCLDQFLQDFLQFTVNAAREGNSSAESEEVNVNGVKKKKRAVRNKKSSKLKSLCENAASNLGGESSTPSMQPLEYYVNTASSCNIAAPEGTTPAKAALDGDIMTPMTKLLKSITSPSGELYLDPTQFVGLVDLPDSATKSKLEHIPMPEALPQPSQIQPAPANDCVYNKIIQVSQPNGTTMNVPIVYCDSNQQVAQYVNEKGVSTVCEIEVMPQQGSYVPFVPKPLPGAISPAVEFLIPANESKQTKKKPGPRPRVKTRGGRQSTGQTRSDTQKRKGKGSQSVGQMGVDTEKPSSCVPDSSETVTLYAADGKDGSSTISYSSSSDLPVLVSDIPDEAAEGAQVAETEPQPLDSSNSANDFEKTSQHQHAGEKGAETETLALVPEDKEDVVNMQEEENCLPPLNSSHIRNTPGLSGPSQRNEKRMSLSTPRRRLSHIRALDFNTPPKENDQSLRRANTSPKNMSTNALSPNTTGKSTKSCARGGLFKAPGDESRRTSKVKAHLFKSPEYPLALSSGFKIPCAAVTSTPGEASSVFSPVPGPSEAWDKVGGVSLILDSDVSPVKHLEPPTRKGGLKSWDSDLRSLLGDNDPMPSPPVRKRKVSTSTQRKGAKRSKKSQEKDKGNTNEKESAEDSPDEKESLNNSHDGKKPLGNDGHDREKSLEEGHEQKDALGKSWVVKEDLEISRNVSTESESAMARVLEDNLMDASSEAASPLEKKILSKSMTEPTSPKPKALIIEKDCVVDKFARNTENGDETHQDNTIDPGVSTEGYNTEKLSKSSSPTQIPGSDFRSSTGVALNPASLVGEETGHLPEGTTNNCQDTMVDEKVDTPVTDPSISVIADRNQLSKATWKECLSFETPMKDNVLANMVPQTPRFVDPSLHSLEDTPRTKIIKALPFPQVPLSGDCDTPIPVLPPTPTIRNTTPSESPTGPAYFHLNKSSPAHHQIQQLSNSPSVKSDNLVNILIQECSRIEADESMKKCRSLSCNNKSEKSDGMASSPDSELNKDDDSLNLKNCNKPNQRDESLNQHQEDKNKGEVINLPVFEVLPEVVAEYPGCARFRGYERKTQKKDINELINHCNPPPKKEADLVDSESDECTVISPQKVPEDTTKCQKKLPKTSVNDLVKLVSPRRSSALNSSLPVTNIGRAEIEAALDQLHGKKVSTKKHLETPPKQLQKMPLSPVVLTPSEQKQHLLKPDVTSVVSNIDHSSKDESSPLHETPVSTRGCNKERSVTPASKKKSASPLDSEAVNTDNESSESSWSESSSDSDSNSSSSSSEEVTPVKENISPAKQVSPVKTRNQQFSDENKPKTTITDLPGLAENNEATFPSEVKSAKSPKNSESEEVLEQQPKEAGAESSNVELKSLIETKDMGTCEKIAKIRNARNTSSSDIMNELQIKRLRTLEQLKKGVSGRHVTKNANEKGPAAADSSKTPNVPDVKEDSPDEDKPHTKENDPSKKVPKKMRSKSENEKAVHNVEPKTKQRSSSDGASKVSDDDEEFKLHLSGDEKEEAPLNPSLEPFEVVERQIAVLGGDDSTSVEMHSDKKLETIGPQTVVSLESKAEQQSQEPQATIQIPKVPSKSFVSSKNADLLVKTLMEKGFGCTLPPPPSERIKKIVPKADEPKTLQKTSVKPAVEFKAKQVPVERNEFVSTRNISSRSTRKSSNGQVNESHLECGIDDEAVEEVVNTSLPNALEYKLTYKGLGRTIPRKETSVAKSLKVTMYEGQPVCLAPTSLFTLLDKAPRRKCDDVASSDLISPRSAISRTRDGRSSRPDSSRWSCGDSRAKSGWERNQGERSSKHRDSRSRQLGSPSPRFRHDRHNAYNRDHARDAPRSQDSRSHSRSDSYSRRHEAPALRSTKSSALKSKSAKEDIEDGEIPSSDSDFETKPTSSIRRRASSPSGPRPVRRVSRESITTADRNPKESEQENPSNQRNGRRNSRSAYPPVRHRIILRPSSEKEKIGSKKCTKGNESTSVADVKRIRKSSFNEDQDDVDLDGVDFPELGEDEADNDKNDSKEANEQASAKSIPSHMVTRRRAPPRSVNAHKASAAESITPVQKGKRKLSTSPDIITEDRSWGSVDPESKELSCSRQSKKASLSSAAKVSKPYESGDIADSSRLLNNFNVDAILNKIHGPQPSLDQN